MNKCAAKDLNLEVLAKNVKFEPKSFAALGLISPGLKVKRKEMKDYYEDVIEEMYKNPLEIEEEGRNEEDEKDSSEWKNVYFKNYLKFDYVFIFYNIYFTKNNWFL